MIVLIPEKKLYKKRKFIIPLRDFVIVNATTIPRVKDLPNVMSDIIKDDDGMRTTCNLDSLAYQMPSAIFDEGISTKRRDGYVANFFTSPDFASETLNIIAYQRANPNKNVYVCIDNEAYEKYIGDYVERIEELLDMSKYNGRIIFTWNSVNEMREFLKKQVEDDVKPSKTDKWLNRDVPDYDEYATYGQIRSLDYDETDEYLDKVDIFNMVNSDATENKEIREKFFKYAVYTKKMIDALGKYVSKNSECSSK